VSASVAGVPRAARLLEAVWERQVRARAGEAVLWGIAASLVVVAVLIAGDLVAPLSAQTRLYLRWIPPLVMAALLAAGLRWLFTPLDSRRVALLAQEHSPALENRLATAVDLREPGGLIGRAFVEETERALAGAVPAESLRPRARAPLATSAGVLILWTCFALIAPGLAAEAIGRWMEPRDAYPQAWREQRARAVGRASELPPPPFGELRWTLTPPAYTGLPLSRGRGDDPVIAIPGSRLELRSHFSSRWSAVRATRIGAGSASLQRLGEEWSVSIGIGVAERGLAVEAIAADSVVSRALLPITVRPDAPPEVELTAPAQDLVLASPAGRVTLIASASDDFQVAGMELAWSRTRGSGETFEYVDGTWPLSGVRPGKRVSGQRTLELAGLGLQAGDVLHVRAVARDRNTVTGPGESVSGTRTIRIARPDELEQVNTDIGFPMELPENPLLSQRMIMIRTERLRERAATLGAAEVRRQAAELAHEQARLRERVGEQVFTRATEAMQDPFADLSFTETGGAAHAHAGEEQAQPARTPEEVAEAASEATGRGTMDEVAHRHDESPILDVNRTLQRIYDLMWGSERELNQASPAAALPHQYEALRLIQEMRRSERRFPRGAIQVDAVDVAAARGTGELKDAAPASRSAGIPLPGPEAAIAELERLSGTLGGDRRSAALSVSALGQRLLATPGIEASIVALVEDASHAASRGEVDRARRQLARARLRLQPALGGRVRPMPVPTDPASAEYLRRLERGP
jgi:hypothetical protein